MTFKSLCQSFWKHHPLACLLLIAFFLPIILMAGLFIAMGVYPFGDNTLFTVDLGQQYIDFYQYYRQEFFQGFPQFFYSFEKGIGGEMLGTWAYYLSSPFLLVLLLFPQSLMSLAVALIILLKLGTASASFQYLLSKKYGDRGIKSLTFSLAYAFIGYLSANQLNIMWLDGVIFLPLVLWGIEKLFKKGSLGTYAFSLALILVTNYYIGYMICLFVVLFFIYRLISADFWTLKKTWRGKARIASKLIGHFTLASLLAGGLAAFSLLPTYHSLMASKGAYQADALDWSFAYPITDILSKFVIGPFNFDQMPEGLPNIFVGSLALILFLAYFTNRHFPIRERLAAFALSLILILSMNNQALNTIWHGWQNPIWYPYRFSFVFSAFILYIGYRHYRSISHFSLKAAIISLSLIALSVIYLFHNMNDMTYLSPRTIWLTFTLMILILLALLVMEDYPKYSIIFLLILSLGEGFTNSALTLTSLAYLKADDVAVPIELSQGVIDQYKPKNNNFYRMAKTFQRTKNDSLQLSYYGLNQFNSTLEVNTSQLFKALGQPSSEVFINYGTGTLITDALFDIRYYHRMSPGLNLENRPKTYTYRPDLRNYPIQSNNGQIISHENPNALGLGFVANADIKEIDSQDVYPIYLQDDILKSLDQQQRADNDQKITQYFQLENFQGIDLVNVSKDEGNGVSGTYRRIDPDQEAYINLEMTIPDDRSYYLTLPGYLNENEVSFYLNGQEFPYDSSFRSTQIYNLASQNQNKNIVFQIKLLTDEVHLQDTNLYSLDPKKVSNLMQSVQSLALEHFDNNSFSGTVTSLTDKQKLVLSFPYSEGWHFTVNDQKVTAQPILEGGMTAIDLDQAGTYRVSAYYLPPGLITGIGISLASLLLYGLVIHPKGKTWTKRMR
ncbi:YfhO family protein [Aerococcus kribbianus]|uniref:YfhO family protein n=1 Tax=Aerococcus kribbianus TaxID=2999064 RepID=A0A9X3FMA6_9LACT|nr:MULTISPECIES: YfhO family protein [unclassified Aerococcus]MCZ0717105.1 YfhO family protein [Aerococcus sp. YH-aer221]MCZ0725393.1 YfhO family protein [Aerococcus sp. YH-aer222]